MATATKPFDRTEYLRDWCVKTLGMYRMAAEQARPDDPWSWELYQTLKRQANDALRAYRAAIGIRNHDDVD